MKYRPRNMNKKQLVQWLIDNSIEVPAPDYVPAWRGPCLEAAVYKDEKGYTTISINGKPVRAHRLVYSVIKSPPRNGHVRHVCDNTACIQHKHLILGTNQDNVDDKVRRGRSSRLFGTCNGCAKLTEYKVRRIRHKYASGSTTYRKLAAEYHVDKRTIGNVVNRKSWNHVP